MCDRTSTRIATAYLRPSNRILYSRIYNNMRDDDITILLLLLLLYSFAYALYIRVYNGTQPVHGSRHHRDFLLDSSLF